MANQLLKHGDKLDKFRAHIVQGRALKEDDLKLMARYRKAVAMLSLGYSRQSVVNAFKLDKDDPLSESQAYQAVKDGMKLYGALDTVDREGMRNIAYENYKRIALQASKDGDHHAALRANENADKLYDLFSPEVQKQDPNVYLVPVPVIFSSEPEVLANAQKALDQGETEDIDYEDAD